MNLPNILTLSRFVMAIVVFWIITWGRSWWLDVAQIIFIVACFTDFFDGWLARRRNQITAFGRIADPFADKFLVAGCLLFLLERDSLDNMQSGLSAVAVFTIIARDFLVNGIRAYAESRGIAFGANFLGKCKAVYQYFMIGLIILYMAHGGDYVEGEWVPHHASFPLIGHVVVWSMVTITLVSAWPYVAKASKELG